MPERQRRATDPCLLYFLMKELEDRGPADIVILTVEPATITLERVDEQGNTVPIVRRDEPGKVTVSPKPQGIVARGGRARAENRVPLLFPDHGANASAAMQWVNVSYSLWFNRRRGRVGHVFQGRFARTLLDGEGAWVLEGLDKRLKRAEAAGLTAVDAEMVKRRLRRLHRYVWSSYGAYVGYRSRPAWLTTEELWTRAGGMAAYRRWLHGHVTRGVLPEGYEDGFARLARGSREFLDGLKGRVVSASLEQPARRELASCVSLEQVVGVIEQIKGERWQAFRDRYGDEGQALALYLARRRSGRPLREIAERLGVGNDKAVSQAIRRFEHSLRDHPTRRQLVREALARMTNVET